jgi:hypothetical protein
MMVNVTETPIPALLREPPPREPDDTQEFAPVPELVGMKEISERLDVPRTTASMWHSRAATTGFPDPVADLRMGPVFSWPDVVRWHEEWSER